MEDIDKKFSELVETIYTICRLCESDVSDEYKKSDIEAAKEIINDLVPDIERYIARKEVRDAQAEALKVVVKNLDIYITEHDFKFYIVIDKVMHEVSREDYYKCVGWIRNGRL